MSDLAQLALSLKDNDAFQTAISKQRKGALEALARVPATDIEAIRDYQATVRVIDDLMADLEGFIRSGTPRPKPGIA